MRSKAFFEGQKHFQSGKPLAIPYPQGGGEYNEFERGWVQALKASPDQPGHPQNSKKLELADDWLQCRLAKKANNDES